MVRSDHVIIADEATDNAPLAGSPRTSFFGRELLLGTRKSGLKVQQFRPFRYNRDAPLLFVERRHLRLQRPPLFRCDLLFAPLEIISPPAINHIDPRGA